MGTPTGTDDYANIVSLGSFKIKHPTLNKYLKLDGISATCSTGAVLRSTVKLDPTNYTTFTLDKSVSVYNPQGGWAGLKTDSASPTYIRQCNRILYESTWMSPSTSLQVFSWMFYKQSNGLYNILNAWSSGSATTGTYLGYDSSNGSVVACDPGDSRIINWQLEFTGAPQPAGAAAQPSGSPQPDSASRPLTGYQPSSGRDLSLETAAPSISPAPSPQSADFDIFNVDTWPWWAWLVLVIFILLIVGGVVYAFT